MILIFNLHAYEFCYLIYYFFIAISYITYKTWFTILLSLLWPSTRLYILKGVFTLVFFCCHCFVFTELFSYILRKSLLSFTHIPSHPRETPWTELKGVLPRCDSKRIPDTRWWYEGSHFHSVPHTSNIKHVNLVNTGKSKTGQVVLSTREWLLLSCKCCKGSCNAFFVVQRSGQRVTETTASCILASDYNRLFLTPPPCTQSTLLRYNCKTFALNGLPKYQD